MMVEVNRREELSSENPMFLKIRYAALGKAFTEIRNKRFSLDEELNKGRISQEAYQKNLLSLIVESNEIRDERKEIGEVLGIH